ncbi:PREDICTED: uncharacterized protein LOC105976216 [Erythranthe guttata]|uniref:uncharacterized protein LOC105976216 n=1 Tax=Erythranthe guttata TaxID=4155 RepID=UPI00064E0044|nr:PREDICTED: uncharacterized protein LOC105976216 [Erythranthe guttata]|eukprot:XP_012856951.1 PREDICTED: uncharacterized protein LOC105976216 [Erythranthe guttata]
MVSQSQTASLNIMSSSIKEPQLTIQSFHQYSSLISIKLSTTNYLMWRSQITPLVRSLGVFHHLESDEVPSDEIKDDAEKKSPNPVYATWIINDGLLLSWLCGTMNEEMLSSIFDAETARQLWKSLEEQLLPITIEKERNMKNMFMTIKKGSRSLNEYLKEFKWICDNLSAIKKPVSDFDKVFRFANGLGPKYENFRLAMLTKPPYPTFSQFVLALQGHEQSLETLRDEEKIFLEHEQAFYGQRERGRGSRGGRFNSRGRGFTPA